MGFFSSDEKPKPKKFIKKSKEQVYKDLKGKPADTSAYRKDPIDIELENQMLSNYPSLYGRTFDPEILDLLANDLQLNNVRITPQSGGVGPLTPEYMRKGELFDIDEMPKESNVNSFTKFLGRFDPFRSEVPLTAEERKNLPLFYTPNRMRGMAKAYEGLGTARDFRTGRKGGEELFEDANLNFKVPSNVDPRMLNSAYLNVNPITLDEMIEAPGMGKLRFKGIQERLAKEKIKQKALDAVKQQVEDEEIDELMKNK